MVFTYGIDLVFASGPLKLLELVLQVLKKADMIRKNAVESILAERDILMSLCNPFVVSRYNARYLIITMNLVEGKKS